MGTWDPDLLGVVTLPSGRCVRGRALRGHAVPDGPPPDLGVYLTRSPPAVPWEQRWVRWPDFWLPRSTPDALGALAEVHDRAAHERVEVACTGGTGRTGTALAALAVLDGVPVGEAVAWVREHYRSRAAETPWQRAWVRRHASRLRGP